MVAFDAFRKPQRKRPTLIESKNILPQLSRAIVIVRMVFAYPVISSWAQRSVAPWEPVALACLALSSLIAFICWDTIVGFISRHPLIISIDIVLSIAFIGVSGPASPYFLYLSATAILVGLLYEGKNRIILTVLLSLLFIIIPQIGLDTNSTKTLTTTAVINELISLLILVALVFLGAQLRNLQDRVDTAVKLASRSAREGALGEERSRIARELHDSTVKSLVGISLLSTSIRTNPERSDEIAKLIKSASESAITESRELLSTLRSGTEQKFSQTLAESLDEIEVVHGVEITQIFEGDEVPCYVSYNVRKIVEEAVTNAAVHSGTDRIDVSVKCDDELLRTTVTDYGRGFRVRKHREGHLGLASMRERASEINGLVSISSVPGKGTTVVLSVTLKRTIE